MPRRRITSNGRESAAALEHLPGHQAARRCLRKGVARVINEDNYIRSLSNAIAAERRYQDMSQERLAELCDLHRNSITLIERGMSDFTVVTLSKFCLALGISRCGLDHVRERVHIRNNGPKGPPLPDRMVNETIAYFVDSLRIKYDISRERLGLHTGVHRNTIARIENAAVSVRIGTLVRIYRHFGIAEAYIAPAHSDNCTDCTVYGVTLRCIDPSDESSIFTLKDRSHTRNSIR